MPARQNQLFLDVLEKRTSGDFYLELLKIVSTFAVNNPILS
jgi:hypothetical protein